MSNHLVLVRSPAPTPVLSPSDESLIASCASGDSSALGTLFDRRANEVAAFLGRVLGGNPEDVDDLLQLTFIETMRSARSFKGGSSARTWLFAIASHVARNHIRGKMRRRRWMSLFGGSSELEAPSPGAIFERRQSMDRLSVAISKLKHDWREVFVLCDIEQIPGPEVCKALGLKPGTLWRRLHEARKELRSAMEAE